MKHSKFYFFDTGVQCALTKKVSVELERRTSDYGRSFEHFIIAEAIRIASYRELDYAFSFYGSSNQAEVDLIVETPKGKTMAIEIKATDHPDMSSLRGLKSFIQICPSAGLYCASLVPRKVVINGVSILPWKELFQELFSR